MMKHRQWFVSSFEVRWKRKKEKSMLLYQKSWRDKKKGLRKSINYQAYLVNNDMVVKYTPMILIRLKAKEEKLKLNCVFETFKSICLAKKLFNKVETRLRIWNGNGEKVKVLKAIIISPHKVSINFRIYPCIVVLPHNLFQYSPPWTERALKFKESHQSRPNINLLWSFQSRFIMSGSKRGENEKGFHFI